MSLLAIYITCFKESLSKPIAYFCYVNESIYYSSAMFQIVKLLLVFQLLQSSDGRLYCDATSGTIGPGTTSYCFYAETSVSPITYLL